MGKVAAFQLQVVWSVAVPGIFLADSAASSSADCSHSLRSLAPPQAALPSLPMVGMTVSVAVAAPEFLK